MNNLFTANIVAGTTMLIFSGCQSIPPEPLQLSEVRIHLSERPLDVEPIRAFADSLNRQLEPTNSVYDPSDGISLREAHAIALWYNPVVREARAEIQYAEDAVNSSGIWPDPIVSPKLGEKEVDTDSGSKRRWIIGSGLSLTIPLSGRLGAERLLRGVQQDIAFRMAQEAEWTVSKDLYQAWIDWSASLKSVELLDEHLVNLDHLVKTTGRLAEAGEISAVDARVFQLTYGQLVAGKALKQSEVLKAKIRILGLMGLNSNVPVEFVPQIIPAFQESNTPVFEISETHPTLATYRARYEEAEKRLHLELRKQYPDLTISPSFEDEENESAFVFGFGLPLPIWNANKAGIAAAVTARKRAREEVEHALQDLTLDLAVHQSERTGAQAQNDTLLNDVSPLLDRQLSETRNLLDVGEFDVLLLHNVLKQSLEIKQSVLNSSLNEQRALISIIAATTPELLVSAPLEEINP